MIDFSLPLAGLNVASERLDQAASRVTQAANPQDSIDLSAEAVAMIQARIAFQANLQALKIEQEIAKSTVELIG